MKISFGIYVVGCSSFATSFTISDVQQKQGQSQSVSTTQKFKTSQAQVAVQEQKVDQKLQVEQDENQKIKQGPLLYFFILFYFVFVCFFDDDDDVEVDVRLRRENGQLGYLTVTLMWNTVDDLDLHCTTPKIHIYFGNTLSGGGILDVDMNAQGDKCSKKPIENIYFPGKPPYGTYEFKVHYFRDRKTNFQRNVPFTLTFRVEDKIIHKKGILRPFKMMVVIF